jgi:hypothetical protein
MMTMQTWTASKKEIRKHEQWNVDGKNVLSSEFNSTINNKRSEQQQARSTTTNIAIANGTGTTLTSRCRIQQDEEATIYYYYYYATSYYNTTINNKMNSITHLLETMHWREIGALSPSPATHLFLLLACFAFLCCV